MRSIGKTTCFLFFFSLILLSPLFTQPLREQQLTPDDESSLPEPQPDPKSEDTSLIDKPAPDKGLLFFEELFISDNIFSFYETLMGEETSSDEDPILIEENFTDKETLLAEKDSNDKDTLPGDESLSDEAALLAGENYHDDDALSGEEPPSDEDDLLAEEDDDYIDDEALFFEAIPMVIELPTFELRSFDTIFPNLSPRDRAIAMGEDGLRNSFEKDASPSFLPAPDLGIDLYNSVKKKNPSHLIEAVVVVPYKERELDLLDVYNALGRIENIKDQTIQLSGKQTSLFSESTRVDNPRNRKPIPDPLPAVTLPFSETMYLRLKEIYLGNFFLRGELSISIYGITYSMTNFTDVRYFLIPIMKAERFITIIYLEPVKEGVLIYSMTGIYLPGFIADRIRLTPNINRRIRIFVSWITDGLRKQENAPARQ